MEMGVMIIISSKGGVRYVFAMGQPASRETCNWKVFHFVCFACPRE